MTAVVVPDPGDLRWSDLTKGDRVKHHEYGQGTVQGSSSIHVWIDWDNKKVDLRHHGSDIVRWLHRDAEAQMKKVCDIPADELARLAAELKAESQLSRVVLTRGAARLQQRISQLESRAKLLRSYQPTMVPGILQTRAYAKVVFSHGLADDDADAAVSARQDRGNALDDETKQFVFVLTEGALRWQASDPRLMTEQLDKIIATSRRTNVRLGVIPWTTPVDVFCTHSFHLYDSAAVVIGTEVAAGLLAAPEDVAVYEQLFARLTAVSSTGDDARRELLRIRNDYQLLGG